MEKDRRRPLDRHKGMWAELNGRIGVMQAHSLQRLWGPEFDEKFLIADLDFNQERWFTNYSGDISGRFLECMALCGREKAESHRALSYMLDKIPANQCGDGHFGMEMDFAGPIDSDSQVPRMMPILWGNARMLPALVEAWLTFGREPLLESAKRLGDFYIAIAGDMEKPDRIEEYRASGTYAPGYATCYFPGMEGLVRLYQVTGEEKYLRQAKGMALFRWEHGFDSLPIEHSHGFLCSVYGLLLLACADSEGGWLKMACRDWENLVEGGYVLPSGGLLEKAVHGYALDEGCSQADWLRVNLLLYCLTGQDRYMDMAERVLYNQMRMNQCASGGFGHRRVLYDSRGVAGYGEHYAEALWCCDFHGAAALMNLKNHVLLEETGSGDLVIPLLLDFTAWNGRAKVTLEETGSRADRREWKLVIAAGETDGSHIRLRVPGWAEDFQVFRADGNSDNITGLKCAHGDFRVCRTDGSKTGPDSQERWVTLPMENGTAEYRCSARCPVYLEKRYLGKDAPEEDGFTFLLRQGPDLLAVRKDGGGLIEVPEGEQDGMEAVYVFRARAVSAEPAQM